MKNPNSTITLRSAVLLLLLTILSAPAWAENVTYEQWLATYPDKSTVTEIYIPNDNVANNASFGKSYNLTTEFPNVKKVTFSSNVTTLGDSIFAGAASLETVEFEGSPVAVGKSAFRSCSKLATVGTVKSVDEHSFDGCTSITYIAITDDTIIDFHAFSGCSSLQSVELPTNLATIKANAFDNAALQSVYLPENVQNIASFAFYRCKALEEIIINSNLSANFKSFSGCSNLTRLTIASNDFISKDWEIGKNLYSLFPYITTVEFGTGVTKIGKYAFALGSDGGIIDEELKAKATIERIIFHGATVVGEFAFERNVNLTTINGGVKGVEEAAFWQCSSLGSVMITDSEEIGRSAFWQCSALRKVYLPENLTTIADCAFWECVSLIDIDIPAGVNTIGWGVFHGCSGLIDVTCRNPVPADISEKFVFYGVPVNRGVLRVPPASIEAYKEAPVWNEFDLLLAHDVTITDGTPYNIGKDYVYGAFVRYDRTFSEKTAGKWQCLYVPFDIPVTEELLKDFDFAKLYMISYKDANGNGEIEDGEPLVMSISKFSEGKTLKGNTPYFIRAKTAGTKSIIVYGGTTLYPAGIGSVDCSTTEHYYKLVGTNEPTLMQGKYGLSTSGGFTYITNYTTKLGAHRWYLEITSRTDNNPVYVSRPIEIIVDGEDDATGIMDIRADRSSRSAEGIFTLDGRKISDTENLPSGIYIKNGKKVVIK